MRNDASKDIDELLRETVAAIRQRLIEFLADKPYTFNSDERTVALTLEKLALNQIERGAAYCPCKIASGNYHDDQQIVCPCAFLEQEIKEWGLCDCGLLVVPTT